MAGESEFIAKVPFDQDPEYKKLMRDLQLRQEQESKKLVEDQIQKRIEWNRKNPDASRAALDDNYRRDLEERKKLSKRHGDELDRHTREYHDAKVLLHETREKEKQQALEDTQKRTR
jgi:hypothetical protein